MPFHLPDSDMETSHVQMYYVPEVGSSGTRTQQTDSSQASSKQVHLQSLQSSALERGDSNKLHRTESLESLLSLNVWASDLLRDHDDLQDLASTLTTSPSERRQAWYGTPTSEGGDSAGPSTFSSSHTRNHSYSTVSSGVPETPPSASQHTFATIESPGGESADTIRRSESSVQDFASHGAVKGKGKEREVYVTPENTPANRFTRPLRSYGRRGIAYELSQRAAGSSRSLGSASNARHEKTLADEVHLPELQLPMSRLSLSQEQMSGAMQLRELQIPLAPLDNDKTPLAEVPDPLADSATHEVSASAKTEEQLGNQLREETEAETGPREDGRPEDSEEVVHSVLNSQKGDRAPDATSEHVQPASFEDVISTQDIAAGTPLPDEMHDVSIEQGDEAVVPHAERSMAALTPEATHSSTKKKLSELLKEQYDNRKPLSKGQIPSHTRQRRSDETQPAAMSIPSEFPSLPTQKSSTSATPAAAMPERDRLLQSIIVKDFGGSQVVTGPSVVLAADPQQLWHPTEYVGPPRRRSFGSTSLLTMKRPATSAGNAPFKGLSHQRKKSLEGLSSFLSPNKDRNASSDRSCASSMDDLLLPPQTEAKEDDPHGDLTSDSVEASHISHLPERSYTPGVPPSSKSSTPLHTSPRPDFQSANKANGEAPFDSMLATSSLPPPPGAASASKPHKRSLSGSIQTLLPGFSSASKAKKLKSEPLPVAQRAATPVLEALPAQKRSTSSLSQNTSSSASSERRDWTEPWTPMVGRQQKVERRISLKAWRYPQSKQSKPLDREPTLPVVSDELLMAPPSPFSLEAPKNPAYRRPHRVDRQRRSSTNTLQHIDPEGERIKGLASEQVARDSHVRAKVVEKFKDHERSVSAPLHT